MMYSHRPPTTTYMTLAFLALVVLALWTMTSAAEKIPPAPEWDTVWMPTPQFCPDGGLITGGHIREDKSAWVSGRMVGEKLVWYLLYTLKDGKVQEAWVDTNSDGDYDVYFDDHDKFMTAYPDPCSIAPGVTGDSKKPISRKGIRETQSL